MSNYYEQNSAPPVETPPTAATHNMNSAASSAGPGNGTAQNASAPNNAQGDPANVGQQGPAWQTPGGNLGQQIGDSVRNMLSNGNWDELKNIGHAVSDTAKEVGNEVKNQVQLHTGSQPPKQSGNNTPQPVNKGYVPNYNKAPRGQQLQTPPWYGKPVASPAQKPTNYAGVGQIVFGSLGIGFFGLMVIPFLAQGILAGAIVFGTLAALSGSLLGSGVGKHGYTGRLLAYQSKLMANNVMTFAELAKATGFPEAQVRKDFHKGLRKRILRYVFLDKEGDTVMLGENTYNLYLQAEELRAQKLREEAERALLMEENPELAQMEAFRAESAEMLGQIRRANEAIPGEEISAKLETMEETCSKIFGYVENHPAKLPDTRKFMSYYLPTTLKVVDKYREYEEMEVQTPSILTAREEIEKSLDTINEAFSNLLDELYKDDTLDVSTDIEVLQTMLQQEGLTGKKFSIEADPTLKLS